MFFVCGGCLLTLQPQICELAALLEQLDFEPLKLSVTRELAALWGKEPVCVLIAAKLYQLQFFNF